MKKILSIAITAMICMCLCACTDPASSSASEPATTSTTEYGSVEGAVAEVAQMAAGHFDDKGRLKFDEFASEIFGGELCTHAKSNHNAFYHVAGLENAGVMISSADGEYSKVIIYFNNDSYITFVRDESSSVEEYYDVIAAGITMHNVPATAIAFMVGNAMAFQMGGFPMDADPNAHSHQL